MTHSTVSGSHGQLVLELTVGRAAGEKPTLSKSLSVATSSAPFAVSLGRSDLPSLPSNWSRRRYPISPLAAAVLGPPRPGEQVAQSLCPLDSAALPGQIPIRPSTGLSL